MRFSLVEKNSRRIAYHKSDLRTQNLLMSQGTSDAIRKSLPPPPPRARRNLTALDLGFNRLMNQGATTLSVALRSCSQLRSLNLVDNWIAAEGATSLSQSLSAHSSLTALVLKLNPLRDEGVAALSPMLKAHTSLTSLNLLYVPCGNEGVNALCEGLSTTFSLKHFELSPGTFVEECIDDTAALANILRSNR